MLSSASFHAATAPLYPFGNYLPFMVFGHDFLLAQSLRAKDMTIYILSIAVSMYCCHTRYAQNWHVHHYIQIQSLRLYFECVFFLRLVLSSCKSFLSLIASSIQLHCLCLCLLSFVLAAGLCFNCSTFVVVISRSGVSGIEGKRRKQ